MVEEGRQRADTGRGEDLRGRYAAEIAQGGPVGSCGKGSVVVGDVFSVWEAGAIGESDVVLGETLVNCCWGCDGKDWAGAEVEEENRAVAVGEAAEGTVEGDGEEVEVADDGDGRGRRGKILEVSVG